MLRQAQFLTLILSLGFFLVFHSDLLAQKKAKPFFKDGEAQVVPAFDNPDEWIRHDLWVETEFDTDGDNKPDRMHVSVTRPAQTENKKLKAGDIVSIVDNRASICHSDLFIQFL